MSFEIKIPAVGESVTEATIAQWMKQDGDQVNRDDVLLVLETDKASVEVVAETAGKLSVKAQEGDTVEIGTVVGSIDESAAGTAKTASDTQGASEKPSAPPPAPATKAEAKPAPKPSAPPAAFQTTTPNGPAVEKMAKEQGVNLAGLSGSGKGGRVTKGDLLNGAAQTKTSAPMAPVEEKSPTPLPQPRQGIMDQTQTRERMSKLRQTIAKRLVEAQHTAAILTTFNEIDMSNVIALRKKYKESFKKRYGINLGFMGFFVKAAIEALRAFPAVNGFIDGTDIVYNNFHNVGIAVGTDKGLLVPVIKNADLLSIAEVEMSIKHYAEKARDGKISMDDLTGGTFTISNGGVYGSLMSTPILNPPQSGILGLHKIEERPMAIDGKVEVRPMMYVALSYDHRIIDGGQSVGFLVKIKEAIEDPSRILLEI